MSPPPLRVTLTHFALISYERALRLSTSSPISDLARLGVKPRFCRSSWRAFAPTHSLMLSLTSLREVLFAFPPYPPWNLPSFAVESTLSSPCPRSDSPLSGQGAAVAQLDSLLPHDLVIRTDGSVPFLFSKGGFGVLANCSLYGTEATLSFLAGLVYSSFLLKPAPFCKLFAGLGSTNKSAIPLLFSSSLTFDLSLVLCPLFCLCVYLNLSGKSGRKCLPFPWVLSGHNGSGHSFLPGTTRLMSWPD